MTMASEQAIVLFVVFLYWFRRFLAEEGSLGRLEAAGDERRSTRRPDGSARASRRCCPARSTSSIPTFFAWKRR